MSANRLPARRPYNSAMPISPPGPETRVYEPLELNRELRVHLEAGFPRLWLSGELSNLSRPASGHWYFTLKDSRAQVRCALFRGQRGNIAGDPVNGDRVVVRGRISLYEARGDCQLIADALLPAGSGDLQQAFEALKKKLEAEGLFAPERKRVLPAYPAAIGVVTSSSGAAIRDVLSTLKRRWPAAAVHLFATPVQGEQAVPELIAALNRLERHGRSEVVIVARGGGSIEDLWPFNDEALARRIAGMPMPVVSGVGHETDFTIADFVADYRAATPTAAAEAVTPDGPALGRQLAALEQRLARGPARQLQQSWQQLDSLDRRLAGQHPVKRLDQALTRLNGLMRRAARAGAATTANAQVRARTLERRLLARHPARRVSELKQQQVARFERLQRAYQAESNRHAARFSEAVRALNNVSPLAVLARGYALVEDPDGKILSHRDDFDPGRIIHVRVRDLRIESQVRRVETAPLLADDAIDREGGVD